MFQYTASLLLVFVWSQSSLYANNAVDVAPNTQPPPSPKTLTLTQENTSIRPIYCNTAHIDNRSPDPMRAFPSVPHLAMALILSLWATSASAQLGTGAVNLGTVSTSSGA